MLPFLCRAARKTRIHHPPHASWITLTTSLIATLRARGLPVEPLVLPSTEQGWALFRLHPHHVLMVIGTTPPPPGSNHGWPNTFGNAYAVDWTQRRWTLVQPISGPDRD